MLLPFHGVLLTPPPPLCTSLECLPRILEQPLVTRTPVFDLIGIEVGYDLQLEEGAYVCLITFLAGRLILCWARRRRT